MGGVVSPTEVRERAGEDENVAKISKSWQRGSAETVLVASGSETCFCEEFQKSSAIGTLKLFRFQESVDVTNLLSRSQPCLPEHQASYLRMRSTVSLVP